jgi:hypothetical protein
MHPLSIALESKPPQVSVLFTRLLLRRPHVYYPSFPVSRLRLLTFSVSLQVSSLRASPSKAKALSNRNL